MRWLVLVLLAVLISCGDRLAAVPALVSPSVSPGANATSLPSGVVDPIQLERRVRGLTSFIDRIDRLSTTLTTRADVQSRTGITTSPTANADRIWMIAVVGRVRARAGLLPMSYDGCGLFAFDAYTGDGWMNGVGPLADCQPYFTDPLTPPDAPVRCAPSAYDNGVSRSFSFSTTRAGPVALVLVRDDAWVAPTVVPGAFLMRAPEGSVAYEDAYCLSAFVREAPMKQALLASAISANPATPFPSLDYAVWLRGYHALSATADAQGHITVQVVPRVGFEWAFFDWRALVATGGYVMFRFVDASDNEILPWRLANGP